MRCIVSIGILIGLTSLAACSGSEEVKEPAPRTIETFLVSSGSVNQEKTYPGIVRAAERSSLSFEASGVITALNVDLGDTFEVGQLLGRVDERQAVLGLESARAQLREGIAERDDAQLDFDRRSALRGTGAIAPAAIDAAEARLERARARVSSLEVAVSTARDRLSDTRLVAPFDGQVVARMREPSEIVSMGQPVLQVVGNGSQLEIVTELPKLKLADVSLSDALVVTGNSKKSLTATVSEIGNDAGAAGLYPVTLSFEDDSIRPGERVSVAIPVRENEGVLTIPLTSYVPTERADEAVVYVLDETNNSLISRMIEVGGMGDGGVIVLSGLQEGERIAARGVSLLRDGETVQTANSAVARYNP
ncbi:MAG: efflux RND transporter periplasmic adaptor subunit [Pseudomonadota bacterium]